jgi:tRNA G18 (ribose-2'-O)-methylase SpoU
MIKLNACQLRQLKKPKHPPGIKRFPIYFILENVYDTYNIGGLFRLADALAIEKIYLCGECETPPNHKIKKASVGTDKVVSWEYKQTSALAIEEIHRSLRSRFNPKAEQVRFRAGVQGSRLGKPPSLEKNNLPGLTQLKKIRTWQVNGAEETSPVKVVAVEQHPKALPYYKAEYQLPLALIFGNETFGILPETLKLVDQIVEIPMFGVNKSLNVIVSAAIVGFHIATKTNLRG